MCRGESCPTPSLPIVMGRGPVALWGEGGLLFAEPVHRQAQVGLAVGFRGRECAGADVHLERREDQARGGEGFVAGLAHGDEGVFGDAVMDMDVGRAVLRDCGFPGMGSAAFGEIVMAGEDAGFGWQREQLAD